MDNPFERKWVIVLGPALGLLLMTLLALDQVTDDGVGSVKSALYVLGWLLALAGLVMTAMRELRQ